MKRRIIWINVGLALLLVAVAAGGYFLLFAPKQEALSGRTVAVQKGTVSETVTATGTVQTAGTVELSFAQGGTVDRVYVAQGDSVRTGRRLVAIDDTQARQGVTSAQSSYVQAVTNAAQSGLSLTAAKQAVTDAERNASLNKASYEQSVQTARTNLTDAQSSWSDSCLDPNGTCPSQDAWAQLRAAEADVTSAKTAYEQAVQTASAQETTNNLKLNQAQVNAAAAQAKQDDACNTFGSDSTQCTTAVSSTTNLKQQYELLLNSNQNAAVQSQQTLVNADARDTQANVALKRLQASLQKQGAQSVTSAQQALDQALLAQKKGLAADQQSVQKAKQSLATAQAAGQSVQTPTGALTASQASIDVARAGLASARQTLRDTVLRSPVAGTVASVAVAKGDEAASGSTVVTVLPEAAYEIVADFSEADAMKIAVGQKASVTFDALPEVTATGTVTAVEILPTGSRSTGTGSTGGGSTSSVTTYAATITLDDITGDIRQGMSASVVVTTDEATDVLWVPTAAVTTAGGQSTVTVRSNGVDTVTQVTTGLSGDSGIEITEGVSEGDEVVVSTSGSSSSTGGFPMGGIPGGGMGGPPAGGGRG